MSKREVNENLAPEDLPLDLKLDTIERSESLEELKRINAGYLPPVPLVKPDNYYFISYSHKDYKRVYKDIFALQARGVNIWYDRGMRAGSDWRDVAEEFITPAKCAGVIFYISENSLSSGAIHTEIEFAKKCGKSCLTVNLPIEEDYVYSGKNMKGEEVSARKLLDIMGANAKCVEKEKYDFISDAFGDDVIFVKYSDGADEKCEKILSMKRPPLIDVEYNPAIGDSYVLIAVNDHDIKKFEENDYYQVNIIGENTQAYSISNIDAVGSCSFANCKRLESVCIPENVDTIRSYTFYGCNNLKRIHFHETELSFGGKIYEVGDGAFYDCFSLEDIDLSAVCGTLGREAFYRCKSLTELNLGEDLIAIGAHAFAGCENLAKINIPENVESIGESAFRNCKSLKNIILPQSLNSLGDYAFSNCESLKEITVPESIKTIGADVFLNCTSLKKAEINCECDFGIWMFGNCENLEAVDFAVVPRQIKARTFINCKKLKKMHLEGTEFVLEAAFENCESLEEIYLSSNLKALIGNCFSGCKNLKLISYGGTMEQWNSLAWTDEQVLKFTEGLNLMDTYSYLSNATIDMIPKWDAEAPDDDKFQYLGLGNAPTVIRCTDGDIVNPEYLVSEIERKLESLGAKKGMKFGTEATRALLNALGSPDDKLKIIHVAGSNGKGSVSQYIQNILRENGVSVGLFTTPAVYDYRECFRINGLKIPRDRLIECFNAVFALKESKNATRFEIETAAAIYAFSLSECEYAILECGMGGLSDATNAVNKKELAVITSISSEHTQYLGNTLKEICAQKAGIIKNCPSIVSAYNPDEVLNFFKNLGAVISDKPDEFDNTGTVRGYVSYRGNHYSIPHYSTAQAYNAVLAVQAAEMLGFAANAMAFVHAILPGRLQHVSGLYPDIAEYILDGAHNPAAFAPLAEHLKAYCREREVVPAIIFGCLADKDAEGCVKQFAGFSQSIITVQPPSPRAMDINKINSVCAKYFKEVKSAESVSAALDAAHSEFVVVCGSFTLLKEAKLWIEKKQ